MKQPNRSNILTAMISASVSLSLAGQSAIAGEAIIPFSSVARTSPPGAAAQCRFHVLNNASSILCNIVDNTDDGDSLVYVEWEVEGYTWGPIKLLYFGKIGEIGQVRDRIVAPVNIKYFNWKVCVDRKILSDSCSLRRFYQVNH